MSFKLTTAYLKVFLPFLVLYSLLNWTIYIKLNASIKFTLLDIWIPVVIAYLLSFLFLRRVVNNYKFSDNTSWLFTYMILPMSMVMVIALSLPYLRDRSYNIIHITSPEEIYKHRHQRFFKIGKYVVDRNNYAFTNHSSVSGKYGTRLDVRNYFVVPIYSDSSKIGTITLPKIAYCLEYFTSISNGYLQKDDQPGKINTFEQQNRRDFEIHNFYDGDYFEKLTNSDDVKYYLYAIGKRSNPPDQSKCILLKKRYGSVDSLDSNNVQIFYVAITAAVLMIGLLVTVDYFRNERPRS